MILLNLLARHFKDTNYVCNCAIEKAAEEMLKEHVTEHVDSLCIHKHDGIVEYNHEWYGRALFNADADNAANANFDDTIIRTIELQEAQP